MNWYDDQNNILVEDMPGLLKIADTPQFDLGGDGAPMTLTSWLLCEAFEMRFDPDAARALHLAAMIVDRAVRAQ